MFVIYSTDQALKVLLSFFWKSPLFLKGIIPKLRHGLSSGLIWWKRSGEGEAPGGVSLLKDTTWRPSPCIPYQDFLSHTPKFGIFAK